MNEPIRRGFKNSLLIAKVEELRRFKGGDTVSLKTYGEQFVLKTPSSEHRFDNEEQLVKFVDTILSGTKVATVE